MNYGTSGTDNAVLAAFAAYAVFITIFGFLALVFTIVVYWRVAAKAGYNGAWSLLSIIPFVNIVLMIAFAFSEWPIQRRLRELTGGTSSPSNFLPPGGYIPPGGGGYAPVPSDYRNPYRNPQPPLPQVQPYGVPPPPPPQTWPADPPDSF